MDASSTSVISGHTGGGLGGAAYGAAKAAVMTLTRNLAHELAPRGITVNSVVPGVIETRIHRLGTKPEDYRALIERTPLKRDGKPEDIVGIVLLLAHEAGSFITGENYGVLAGHLETFLDRTRSSGRQFPAYVAGSR